MKKFGTRLISAVLAGCMMTSVLPASAFAAGVTGSETGVSAQASENQEGRLEDGEEITESGTYSMSGPYTGGIVIDAPGDDVIINVTAETTFDKGGNKDDCANFITVRNAKSVTVNAEGQTITAVGRNYSRCFYAENSFTGTAVLNGGTYNMQCDDIAACYLLGGSWTFDDLTMNAVNCAIETDKGANVTVNGGTYDCSESFSSTFLIKNSPNSSFTGVTATGVGWVLNAVGSQVDVVGGSYSRTYKDFPRYKDRPTLRASDNATLNVTDAEVTGTYCDVFVVDATANLFGGTYTNTNQYLNLGYESPALKVWGSGNSTFCGALNVKDAVVECQGGNAAISSGEPAGSDYDNKAGGKLVVENCTIKNSKYGIYLGWGSNASAELKSAKFEGNESDIYLDFGKKITISDTFTDTATVKVADSPIVIPRQITTADTPNQQNLKLTSNDGYLVAYDSTGNYRYLTEKTAGKYTVTAEHATAAADLGSGEETLYSYTEINAGTKVTLKADPAPAGEAFDGWEVLVDGTPDDALLEDNDAEETHFWMPAGNVTVRAKYKTVVDPVDPSGADNIKGALSAVVVGAAAGVIIYEAGTGIYRVINMPGIILPSNRIELAELLWERADKPEPVSTALYDDIDEDDTDAQKAAHWAVEQDLMQDDEDDNEFHPHFPVSKLRTCLTWNAAKEKGLID